MRDPIVEIRAEQDEDFCGQLKPATGGEYLPIP